MKIPLLLVVLFSLTQYPAPAQEKLFTEFGLTGGPVNFYPQAHHPSPDWQATMHSGWGWSMGIFIEDNWRTNLHPVVELNHYTLSTDVHFSEVSAEPAGNNNGQQDVSGHYSATSFNHLAFSGGIKYFFIPELFAYPAFEVARALNPKVNNNRFTFRAKLAAGVNLRVLDVILEYAWGLYRQRIVFNEAVPYVSNYRNTFLQLKIQVPLYKIGKRPDHWQDNRYLEF